MSTIVLPPFGRTALLLDLDGTLLDIAPTPDSVVVPPGLTDSLRRITALLDGAVAVVTGRPIETIDALLGDSIAAVAGEHGAAVRHSTGGAIERPDYPPPPQAWLDTAARLVAAHPGTLLEPKARGFAVHFRLAQSAGQAVHECLAGLLAGQSVFELLGGTMLWEVRPAGAHKGRAVNALMERAPFAARVPVFIGDDVTDEDGMRVARAMGGLGLRVDAAFGDPPGVRQWLLDIARLGDWAPLPGG